MLEVSSGCYSRYGTKRVVFVTVMVAADVAEVVVCLMVLLRRWYSMVEYRVYCWAGLWQDWGGSWCSGCFAERGFQLDKLKALIKPVLVGVAAVLLATVLLQKLPLA